MPKVSARLRPQPKVYEQTLRLHNKARMNKRESHSHILPQGASHRLKLAMSQQLQVCSDSVLDG